MSTARGIGEDGRGNNVGTPQADEGNESQASEAEGSRSDEDLSVDDDGVATNDEDLSADLSLSDNEPGTAAVDRMRTRSGRDTRRVNYKDLHNTGTQQFQSGVVKVDSSDDGDRVPTGDAKRRLRADECETRNQTAWGKGGGGNTIGIRPTQGH